MKKTEYILDIIFIISIVQEIDQQQTINSVLKKLESCFEYNLELNRDILTGKPYDPFLQSHVLLFHYKNRTDFHDHYIKNSLLLEKFVKNISKFIIKIMNEIIKLSYDDYESIKKILNDESFSIINFLNDNKKYFIENSTNKKDIIISNVIFCNEKKKYSDINILGYNFFGDLNSIFNYKLDDYFFIWRFTFFLNNKEKINNNKIINIKSSKKLNLDNEYRYIIYKSDQINLQFYKTYKKIIKIFDSLYLLENNYKNIKKHEFFDLSMSDSKSLEKYMFEVDINYFFKSKIKFDYNFNYENCINLNSIFKFKEIEEFKYYQKLLNLKKLERKGKEIFNDIKYIKEEKENLYSLIIDIDFYNKILKQNDFYKFIYKLLINEKASNNDIFLSEKLIYKDMYFPEKNFKLSEFEIFKQNLTILIREYYPQLSSNIVKDFINLLIIYSLYHNIYNINQLYYNLNIINFLNNYIEQFKSQKNINFNSLFKFINNENKEIQLFLESLPQNYIESYRSFLNSFGYDRVNKLFIFLEGYVAYISSFFVSSQKIIEYTSFENFKTEKEKKYMTFGLWKNIIETNEKEKIIDLTNLTIDKIDKFICVVKKFHNLRNDIKGHGCYYNLSLNKSSELEHYFFDNLSILIDINIEIKNINKIEHKMFYEKKDTNLILTFKTFFEKNGLFYIDFYNYSNPSINKIITPNLGEYLYQLNVKEITDFFIENLYKYYKNKINENKNDLFISNRFEYNFHLNIENEDYKSDMIVFDLPIYKIDKDKIINETEELKNKGLYLNGNSNDKKINLIYKFDNECSIFEEKNVNKITSKIELIQKIIEQYIKK